MTSIWGFLLVISCVGCNQKNAAPPPTPNANLVTPTSVTIGSPKKQTIRWTFEQPGTVHAYEITPLMAKVPGFVKAIYVDIDDPIVGPVQREGSPTTEGTLLAEIEMPELFVEVKQKESYAKAVRTEVTLAEKNSLAAEATLKTAKAHVEEAKAREKAAKSNYERWKSEALRVDELVAAKVVDKQTAEETRNQYRSAEGAWEESMAHTKAMQALAEEALAKHEKALAEVKVAEAKANAADAEVNRLQTLLQYAKIHAPFDGIVTTRHVHKGHLLQSGKPEPILTVARIDLVRLIVDVPEDAASQIRKGMSVKVRLPALRQQEVMGSVSRTSWALDNPSRTLRAEIDLPNPDRKIRPGMYAHTAFTLEIPDALTIPTTALQFVDDTIYCYLAEGNKAIRWQVLTGKTVSGQTEVLKRKKAGSAWENWTGTEQLILSHQGPLTDGGTIEAK